MVRNGSAALVTRAQGWRFVEYQVGRRGAQCAVVGRLVAQGRGPLTQRPLSPDASRDACLDGCRGGALPHALASGGRQGGQELPVQAGMGGTGGGRPHEAAHQHGASAGLLMISTVGPGGV